MDEKKKRAVALKYNETKNPAPIVSAKGKGYIAEKIIERAKENQIPLYEDAALVEMLDHIQLNEMIPEALFQAVAEVFAFVYRLDEEVRKKKQNLSR